MPSEGFLDNGNIRLRFSKTSRDTNGELLEMEAIYRPTSSPPPAHFHPKQEETFTVVSGSLRFVVEGQERIVGSGSRVVIPQRVIHAAEIRRWKRLESSGRSVRRLEHNNSSNWYMDWRQPERQTRAAFQICYRLR